MMRATRWSKVVPGLFLILTASSAFALPPGAPTAATAKVSAPAPPKTPATASTIVHTTDKGEVRFDVHAKDSDGLFKTAADKWDKSLDVPKLRVELTKIADGKPVTDEQLLALKALRKDGNVLRGTFVLLDKDHEAPKKLDTVVTKFGKMNDAIAAGDKEMQVHYARSVLKSLDEKALHKEVKEFEPASHKSFTKHMDDVVKNLETSLDKAAMPAPEFHDMRKSLTKVLNILTLAPGARNDPKIEALYQKVFATQTEMGTIHDDLSAKSMRGEINYDTYEVKLPAQMKTDLREIVNTLE